MRVASRATSSTALLFGAIVAALAVLLAPSPAFAAKVGGVELPASIEPAGRALELRGAGVRKRLFLKLYVAALYSSVPVTDAAAAVDADAPMAITLRMVSDLVTRDKMVEALNDGFRASTGGDTASIQTKIDAMLAAMDQPIVEGDVYTLAWEPGAGTHLLRGDDEAALIPGLEFKRALFGIWLSDEPVQKSLKKAMLGG